ncbi:GNAT family N-acetyltransferase [Pseudomonas atagonensis]|uniref:GNAT family N-acetyltransferase n=1 Tax=Pseudomonas atagonensis TaxID=2609964 RepID=UPI00140DF923|nr:GNAT family N-acetyltransferase [Pseudomonas atagonensis]
MALRIELSPNPTEEQRMAIVAPLRAYNRAHGGPSSMEPFALLIQDDEDAILGGLYGHTFYRWMFVDLLAVPEQGRGQGIGRDLMEKAEAMAREKDCVGIWLDTFSFQAPEFYKKLGFTECGMIEDYPLGHKRHFFQKRLLECLTD